ncbi:lipoprotein-releasing ABC transporter permease subunit [Teredinibacter purpureus]|uniref:lipoprotein-releasing ABC transporter permease subunit n=1 Tax=Teredinibacter purpureus TaxID=2731756 RepID=UPI0005F7939B|nr:lipoprotein-releasing ABC transporter permease subunit [Teredinibacter purpureus]
MKVWLPLFVGLRYVGAQRRSQLVSFLSAISISGLVVGVALLVVVLSVMNGFDRELREKILGLVPQATIKHREGLDNWQYVVDQLKGNADIVGIAPFVELNGLVSFRKKTEPVLLYGIDPQYETKVSDIERYVIDTNLLTLLAQNDTSLLLGSAVATKIGVAVGDKVMVVVPGSEGERSSAKVDYFTLIGIIDSKTELDHTLALTGLEQASNLAGMAGKVSGVRLKLRDLFAAPRVVYTSLIKLGAGYTGTNWTRTQGNLYHAIQMSKNLVGLLMSLIVGIAAFNVVSTLIMVVIDKQGEIAILRTLGTSTKTIMAIFIVQGSVIGLVGTSLGIALGCLMAMGVQGFVQFIEGVFHIQFLQSDVYPLTYLPSEIRSTDLFRIASTALSLSFIATLYPAWKATRVQPAEALRYE